jgi:peptidyl-prolyl cis-trans isomerase C
MSGRPRLTIGGVAPPIVLLALAAMLAAVGPGCERRQVGRSGEDPGPVVARVNGQPLYRRDLDAYLPEESYAGITSEESKTYLDRWVTTQLLYEEALRSGLDVSRDIEWRLEQYRKDLVADRLVQDVLRQKAIVTRDEVMKYYAAHKDEFNLEVRVSHILTNNIEDAEEAQEMLKTRPFSWVARKLSVDKHTGSGGDLGYLSKGNMLPEFEAVVFDMRVGEVSDIIESEFGYHIVKLTDVRTALNELPFETVAPEISRQLLLAKRAAVYDSLITALTARARVEIVDPEMRYAVEMAESLKAEEKAGASRERREFGRAVPEPVERVRTTAEPARPDTTAADTTGEAP